MIKFLLVPILYVRRVIEPANQELASTATPEPIHNNTDIIEIDESTTISLRCYQSDASTVVKLQFK